MSLTYAVNVTEPNRVKTMFSRFFNNYLFLLWKEMIDLAQLLMSRSTSKYGMLRKTETADSKENGAVPMEEMGGKKRRV